jgi:hypothetical protein
VSRSPVNSRFKEALKVFRLVEGRLGVGALVPGM